MKNEFIGYPLFNHIRNSVFRAYNRSNIYMNIRDRHGSVPASNYLKKLDRQGRMDVLKMMTRFREKGYEQTRRDFIREGFTI